MAESVVYNGVTIWSDATTGIEWRVTPGAQARESITAKPTIGTGAWSKPGNLTEAEWSVSLAWRVTGAQLVTLLATLQTASDGGQHTLVLPVYGSVLRCVMGQPTFQDPEASDESKYLVRATIPFTQMP